MKTPIPGLHHVTAIASDPQQNLDFYTWLAAADRHPTTR